MGHRKQRRKTRRWFDPARRQFVGQLITYIVGLTTIISNIRNILSGPTTAPGPVELVSIRASDVASIKLTPETGTISVGTAGPEVVIA